MYVQNLVKFCQFILKIWSGHESLVYIIGHNSGTNVRKMMCNNPKLNLIKINANTKFGEVLSFCSEDI